MARTYALRAPFNDTGIPYGPIGANTGNPTTGTPAIPAVAEENEVTLSGTPQAFSAGSAGVTDVWDIPVGGGGPTDGDTITVTIAGGATSPYIGTYHSPDPPTVVFGDITALIAIDGQYTGFLDIGTMTYSLTANAPGLGHVVTASTDSLGITVGPAVNSAIGADPVAPTLASTAGVTDGTNSYSVTYTAGTLDDLATALAAAIDGNNGYTATAVGSVVTVSGAYSYTLTDTSSNGVAGAVVVTVPGNAYVPASPSVTINSSTVMSLTNVDFASIWCKLVSGTSCVVTPWFYDKLAGVWAAQTPVTVNADKVIQLDVRSIANLFVEQSTFVGAGVVEVTCVGSRTSPGYNG